MFQVVAPGQTTLAVEHYPIFRRKIILKSVQFSLGVFIHVHTVFRNPHPPKDAEEIPSGNGTPTFSSMISLYKPLWRPQGFSALAFFDDTKGCFADLPFRFHGHCLKMTIIYIYMLIRYKYISIIFIVIIIIIVIVIIIYYILYYIIFYHVNFHHLYTYIYPRYPIIAM